jgi:hypothetical protein
MPATKRFVGMARSYGCPAITSDLASIVCLPSRMAITNDFPSVFRVPVQKFFGCWVSQMAITSHLATVLWLLSGMASCSTSSHISSSIKSFSDIRQNCCRF